MMDFAYLLCLALALDLHDVLIAAFTERLR